MKDIRDTYLIIKLLQIFISIMAGLLFFVFLNIIFPEETLKERNSLEYIQPSKVESYQKFKSNQ